MDMSDYKNSTKKNLDTFSSYLIIFGNVLGVFFKNYSQTIPDEFSTLSI